MNDTHTTSSLLVVGGWGKENYTTENRTEKKGKLSRTGSWKGEEILHYVERHRRARRRSQDGERHIEYCSDEREK
jgi:hypothetical protein